MRNTLLSIRSTSDQAIRLDDVALKIGCSRSQLVRTALYLFINECTANPATFNKVKAHIF
jgi:predicted transcriptional regulator